MFDTICKQAPSNQQNPLLTLRRCSTLPDAFAFLRSPMATGEDDSGFADALDAAELWENGWVEPVGRRELGCEISRNK